VHAQRQERLHHALAFYIVCVCVCVCVFDKISNNVSTCGVRVCVYSCIHTRVHRHTQLDELVCARKKQLAVVVRVVATLCVRVCVCVYAILTNARNLSTHVHTYTHIYTCKWVSASALHTSTTCGRVSITCVCVIDV
jgi:hypothetical protein